jgi:hypothetical protein
MLAKRAVGLRHVLASTCAVTHKENKKIFTSPLLLQVFMMLNSTKRMLYE